MRTPGRSPRVVTVCAVVVASGIGLLSACQPVLPVPVALPAQAAPETAPVGSPAAISLPQPGNGGACSPISNPSGSAGDSSAGQSGAAEPGAAELGAAELGTESISPTEAAADAGVAAATAVADPAIVGELGSVPVLVTTVDSSGEPQFDEVVSVDPAASSADVLAAADQTVADGGAVLAVEPVVTMTASGDPVTNDPKRVNQWALQQFSFETTWSRGNGSGVCVAVVDSGIQTDHPDLAGKVAASYNFSVDPGLAPGGHGTHVAGIIAAVPNNSVGIVGAAPGVDLLNAKALRASDGRGNATSVANAIKWAVNSGADVVNLSLGGDESTAMTTAINYAQAHDVVVVAAAGNDGQDGNTVNYPAALEWPIAVASVSQGGSVSNFSTRGAYVDVAAPGENIVSTYTGGGYQTMSGTSMATPYVTALAALAKSAHPGDAAVTIRGRVVSTVSDRGTNGWDSAYGFGIIAPVPAVG